MQKEPQTSVSEMKMIHRMPIVSNAVEPVPEIQWRTRSKPAWCEHLLKNLSVAAALVICAVAVRSGSLENADWSDAVLTAATGDTLLDDQLGKLTFVSSLFPEATLVFGENIEESLPLPVRGGSVVHTWSETEPYLSYHSIDTAVQSVTSGEVMGVYHGKNEELIVCIRRSDGLECCYGNLAESLVSMGDQIAVGQFVGNRLADQDATFEVRQNGFRIDPTRWMQE